MNEDMPWVNLTQEEVDELRNKKHELTEYGKQRLKELMNKDLTIKTNGKETFSIPSQTLENLTLGTKVPETQLEIKMTENYPDAMFEEAERRERANRVLERYNHFYNIECSGLAHGTPITPEFQQAMALECLLDALRCENLNHEFDMIPTADINALIEGLYQQGRESLKNWEEFEDSANGVA